MHLHHLPLHRRALFRLRCQDKGSPPPLPPSSCRALCCAYFASPFGTFPRQSPWTKHIPFFLSLLLETSTHKNTRDMGGGEATRRETRKFHGEKRINVNKIFPLNSPDPKSWYLQTGGRWSLPASPSSPGEEGKKGGQ